jgi:hypothetical protein
MLRGVGQDDDDECEITVRYLATGDSFTSLQYLFIIPQSTISKIIPEVLDSIYKTLVNQYLKVYVIHLRNSFIAS